MASGSSCRSSAASRRRRPRRRFARRSCSDAGRSSSSCTFTAWARSSADRFTASKGRTFGKDVWVNLGEAEAILPDPERIPGERYHAGQRLRCYLVSVEETQGDPRILLSRAAPQFVEQLLRLEVPEIEEGTLVIRKIAREAGRRTKVAVESLDRNVDPVGTCVGAGGARVRVVTRELSGEKIDLIRWSEDLPQLMKNGLEPASVISVELDEENRTAKVLVPDDELSLAIGRGGQNVRLTAKLVGYDISVTSPSEAERSEEEA